MLPRILCALLIVLLPVAAAAAEVTGQSRTYFQVREIDDDDTLARLHEYIDLSIMDIDQQGGVSFHIGGWGRVDVGDEIGDDGSTEGDLQYAYLAARFNALNTTIKAGRMFVVEGIASEQVDGLYASADLGAGFTAAAFGGNAVESGGDGIYGGRIGHSMGNTYRLGVSYLFEDYQDQDREEVGYDISLFPLSKVSFQGRAAYNLETSGWAEHNYALKLALVEHLTIRAELSFTDYESLFDATNLSAFRFPTLNPEEDATTYGVDVAYEFGENFTVAADYKHHDYDIAGGADYYGGGLTYVTGTESGAGISYHRMDGDTDRLKYHEVRAYAFHGWEKVEIAVDFIDVIYDEDRDGEDAVYSVTLAGAYKFTPELKLGGDIEYLKTPEYDEDVRALLNLRYVFGKIWGGV